MSPFVFCGDTSSHLPHTWPDNAPGDEANTCEGRQFTTHPTRLVKVRVPFLGVRWSLFCESCGSLLDKPTDRESAEALAKGHERMVTA